MDSDLFYHKFKSRAKELGFADVALLPITENSNELSLLKRMIGNSYHGKLLYLEKNHHLRQNPALFLSGAKTIAVVLISYKPAVKQKEGKLRIASYAYGKDYHVVLKERMHLLAKEFTNIDNGAKYRVFSDSAPIFERALAKKGGLGFIGKNTFLISKEHGLHTFIGTIITDFELDTYNTYPQVTPACGSCTKCIDACPTGALVGPYVIDVRRCISYMTIEDRELYLRGADSKEREGMIFGCDICLEACPWSRRGERTKIEEFSPIRLSNGSEVISLESNEWLEMDRDFFYRELKESALMRAGLEKIKNNVRYEMANKSRDNSHSGEDKL